VTTVDHDGRSDYASATSYKIGKVLHVFDHSFPVGDGYANRSGEIIRFLRRAGWQTIHVTSAKQGRTSLDKETVSGLEYFRTQPSSRAWHTLPILDQWSIVTTLRRRLEEILSVERPKLLHVHSPCLNALAALPLARRLRLPLIYEVRALWEDGAVDRGACKEGDARYRVSRMLETRVCRSANHVVTICQGLRNEMVSRGLRADQVTVAPNSVDLKRFCSPVSWDEATSRQLRITKGKTMGFIGSFFPFEGLDVLMKAVPLIRSREPMARFVIVGDGPDTVRIRELAQKLSVQDAVTFTGRVPHHDVERYYGLIDIMIYPRISNRVTELVTPLKPLEAMAQGKIVVASNVGGHREMVFSGRNGVLFAAGDPQSLADACLELIQRPESWSALRENAQKYVTAERSWARNIEIYEALYEKFISQHGID
jgi:PEP-CTERM/exosortase A-associated glycosyltransferase